MQISLIRFLVSAVLAFLLFGTQIGEAHAYLTPGEAFGLPVQGVDNGSSPQESDLPPIPTLVPQENTIPPQVSVPSVAPQVAVPPASSVVHGASEKQHRPVLPASGMATTSAILISIILSIVFFYSRSLFYF